jgi:hypothetical protein
MVYLRWSLRSAVDSKGGAQLLYASPNFLSTNAPLGDSLASNAIAEIAHAAIKGSSKWVFGQLGRDQHGLRLSFDDGRRGNGLWAADFANKINAADGQHGRG